MNSLEKNAPSEFLQHIVELNELISAGYQADLPLVEWKAIALLKRKQNQAELKRLREKK